MIDDTHAVNLTDQGSQEAAPARAKRRTPGVFQRGSRWQIDTFYRHHRIRASFLTREAAEANLSKAKSLIDEGKWLEKKEESTVTLGAFSREYLQWCRKIGQQGIRHKDSHMKRLLAYFGTEKLLGKITKKDIETYQAERISNQEHQIKGHAVNRELSTLRHLFNKAIEWNKATVNPCRGVKKLEEPRSEAFFTPEEVQRLLDASDSPMKEIIGLAAHTGMRKSEILGLEWERIRLNQGYIELRKQKSKKWGTVTLTDTAADIIRGIVRIVGSPWAFPSPEDHTRHRSEIKRLWTGTVKKAGIPYRSFKSLRHTTASLLAMAGADIPTIKEVMRHQDIKTTMRYSHLTDTHKRQAIDMLDSVLHSGQTDENGLKRQNKA